MSFIQSVLDGETAETTGQGPVLIYPCRRSRVKTPFLRVPEGPIFYLLAILRNTIPPTDPQTQLDRNRAIYDHLVSLGGVRYPVSSVPFSPADWREHFGGHFQRFAHNKETFDPDNILTPGQGIFPI